MIGSSKNNRENYRRKFFWTREKETRVKFNPGLSVNRPSNNSAQIASIKLTTVLQTYEKNFTRMIAQFAYYAS